MNEAASLSIQAMASAISPGSATRPQRARPGDSVGSAGVTGIAVDARPHGARCHADHAHAVGGDLFGQAECERVDPGLCGGVVHVLARRATCRCRRADVDEHATVATVGTAKCSDGGAGDEHSAGEVDFDDSDDHVDRRLCERSDVERRSGVVDDRRQPAGRRRGAKRSTPSASLTSACTVKHEPPINSMT